MSKDNDVQSHAGFTKKGKKKKKEEGKVLALISYSLGPLRKLLKTFFFFFGLPTISPHFNIYLMVLLAET